MKVFACVLLAVAARAAPEADPALLYGAGVYGAGVYGAGVLPYAFPAVSYAVPKVETEVIATNAAVPVAVGGYKAVAGDNGELKGAVHEVPALFGAPALNTQENADSKGSLTVGTSAFLSAKVTGYNTIAAPAVHYIGKREAEADPALLYNAYGYGLPYAGYGYGLPYAAPALTYTVPKVETEVTATNLPVPLAVGGYKAVAGDNGELKGAVHEVPALFGAPALNTQENEGTSLTVGTSAVLTAKVTGYNTVAAPAVHYIGKREAEAEADPALLYSAYGYGYPYAGYAGYGGYGYAGYGYGGYAGYAGYAGYGGYGYPYIG